MNTPNNRPQSITNPLHSPTQNTAWLREVHQELGRHHRLVQRLTSQLRQRKSQSILTGAMAAHSERVKDAMWTVERKLPELTVPPVVSEQQGILQSQTLQAIRPLSIASQSLQKVVSKLKSGMRLQSEVSNAKALRPFQDLKRKLENDWQQMQYWMY